MASPLEISFQWPQRTVLALLDIVGEHNLRQSALCTATASTSFFSGIGSAEIAWQAIGAAMSACGLPFRLRATFTCEKDQVCQQVLLRYTACHVYTDLMDMMSTVPGHIESAPGFGQKVRLSRSTAVRLTARCCRCQGRCFVRVGDIDTSGSPCQDWSRAGSRRGELGPRAHLLLLWVRWHRVMETPIIIHENVKGFDLSLLTALLGDMYRMSHVVVGPEHVGWPCCRRPRIYVALFHRRKVKLLCDPSWLFWQLSPRLRTFLRVRDCLIARVGEVFEEGQQRATSARTRGPWAAAATGQCHPLTAFEDQRLTYYCKLWSRSFGTNPWLESDLIFNLGDNPDGGWVTWSAPGPSDSMHRVPTFRRKWTAQWLPSKNRWLTTSERCVCMGFPASTELAVCLGLVGQYQLSWHQRHTVGNAMHLANVGVWQACVAASAILLGCSS